MDCHFIYDFYVHLYVAYFIIPESWKNNAIFLNIIGTGFHI